MNKKDILVWMKEFRNFKELVKELLYPSVCVICGGISKQGICVECQKDYPIIRGARCMCCGKPIENSEVELCEDCNKNRKNFYQGRSLWIHRGGIKNSVYLFKYKNRRIYGETYAKLLVKEYGDLIKRWQPECIIPVPCHRSRKRKRGYNQAEVLAQYLEKELKYQIPINTNLIYRKNETVFQKTLDNKQRKKNLRGAFGLCGNQEMPQTVLLVDDIYTTGATMQEIAKQLQHAGVGKVVFLTISVGQGY